MFGGSIMKKPLVFLVSAMTVAISTPLAADARTARGALPDDLANGNHYPLPPGPPSLPVEYEQGYSSHSTFLEPESEAEAEAVSNYPLAGNLLMASQGNSSADCKTVRSTKTAIFATNFVTGPVSSYVEVNYSGQFAMGPTTTTGLNRIFLQCAIRLASQTQAEDVACAAMSNAYIVARRPQITGTTNFPAITNTGSYIGYASGLAPDTEYTVSIYAYTGTTPANDSGTVCYSNMTLRY
jgi:hypothetical protein